VRVALVVEAVGNPPRTLDGQIGKQIDHLALTATAIDQSLYGIASCPTHLPQTTRKARSLERRSSKVIAPS